PTLTITARCFRFFRSRVARSECSLNKKTTPTGPKQSIHSKPTFIAAEVELEISCTTPMIS
ncbi:hypothetical protein JMJ77_0001435, partial [Colletotrichum scovillei]